MPTPTDHPTALANGPAIWKALVPRRAADAHKHRAGHGLVVSGGEFQTGASRLSAQAALHGGCGAVTICGAAEALRIHASHVTAIMLREAPSPADFARILASRRFDSVMLGPAAGVTPATRARLDHLIAADIPAVLDADALSVIGGHTEVLAGRKGGCNLVLTPHEGEFERLFGASLSAKTRHSRVDRALVAARLTQAVVVLKGPGTVIAAPDGRAVINGNGGPELATAGSGDVLAGLVAAHLAQGMPAFEAAASAVWLHAETGARYGIGLTAERLVEQLRPLAAHVPVATAIPGG